MSSPQMTFAESGQLAPQNFGSGGSTCRIKSMLLQEPSESVTVTPTL